MTIKQLRSITGRGNVLFTFESASAYLVFLEPETARLMSVYSRKRGEGHARSLMKLICEWADAEEIDVMLAVGRYGYHDSLSLDNEQLAAFYVKFGFETLREPERGILRIMQRTWSSQEKPVV